MEGNRVDIVVIFTRYGAPFLQRMKMLVPARGSYASGLWDRSCTGASFSERESGTLCRVVNGRDADDSYSG